MKAHTYSTATIMLGGKPLCAAESVTVSEAPGAREVLPPFHATLRCTADLDAVAAMFDAVRLPPSQPRGYVTIPWGILGPLRLQGIADLPSWQVTETGAAGAFRMADNEVDRAVSVAVQRAIMNPYRLDYVAHEAVRHEDPAVRAMGRRLVAPLFPGGCYRGVRKRRKAMRRLLRAAGILGGQR